MAKETYSGPGDTEHRSESTTQHAKQVASDAASEAKHQAAHLADQAKSQVKTQISGQKDQATEQLESISSALRSTSENLRHESQDTIAGYVSDAARQVDRLSGYLRHHTVGELLDEAERYARREPALFLGGAMLAGLFGARFFKSSTPDRGYERGIERGPRGDYGPRGARAYSRRPYTGSSYTGRDMQTNRGFASGQDDGRQRTTSADYEPVHGTAGAEMPDTDRTSSASTSSAKTALGTTPNEGGRNA